MSYEQKPVDGQPPHYGAQSPAPQSPPVDYQQQKETSQYPQQPPMQQQNYQQAPPQGYQQQPSQNYQQQPQANNSGVGATVPIASLQQSPAPVHCPSCGQRATTTVTQVTGNTTHAWAAVICCCFCLGCIPYLMSSLKDVEHRCSNCGVHLATWHKSGRTDVKMHG